MARAAFAVCVRHRDSLGGLRRGSPPAKVSVFVVLRATWQDEGCMIRLVLFAILLGAVLALAQSLRVRLAANPRWRRLISGLAPLALRLALLRGAMPLLARLLSAVRFFR